MDAPTIKRQMMKLWKDTFHDSDDYISLVFNQYFNPDLICYRERGGKLIAGLLGVPYKFKSESNDKDCVFQKCDELKGLYLCGLATDKNFRGEGIMTEMIEEINAKAAKYNYDFTFLIPSSDSLNYYYRRRGYVNCFKRIENRFVSNYKFIRDKKGKLKKANSEELSRINEELNLEIEIFLGQDIFKLYSGDRVEELCGLEIYRNMFSLNHTVTDLKTVLEENEISDGGVVIIRNSDNKVLGFSIFVKREDSVIIPHVYSKDIFITNLILQSISDEHPDLKIILYTYPELTTRTALWSPMYTEYSKDTGIEVQDWRGNFEYKVRSHPQNYGMARITRVSEILKFVAKYSVDSKFSILITGENEEPDYLYIGESGVLKVEKIIEIKDDFVITEDEKNRKRHKWERGEVTVLTLSQLGEILWRNEETPDYTGMAFSLPRLPFNMAYLLD